VSCRGGQGLKWKRRDTQLGSGGAGYRYAPFALARYYLANIDAYFTLFNTCRKAADKKTPAAAGGDPAGPLVCKPLSQAQRQDTPV